MASSWKPKLIGSDKLGDAANPFAKVMGSQPLAVPTVESPMRMPEVQAAPIIGSATGGSGIGGAVGLNTTGGGGSWSGAMGAVPNHKGWAGMQVPAQQWSLRLMGQFPGLRFSSGYRTPAQNAAANGHPNSGHMRGWKADFSGPSSLLHQAAAWAKAQGAKILLHNAGSGFHLDVSWEGMKL